jgi:hypothetical protein
MIPLFAIILFVVSKQGNEEMNEQILEKILSRKGQIATIRTARPMKVRKGMPEIIKHSEFQCRVGVNYDNIAVVKEKRADGRLPEENQGLPWGEWEIFPFVIRHGAEKYVRCTVLRNGFHRPPVYTVNGAEISADEAKGMALASEFRPSEDNDVFTVKVSSVLSVT